MTDLSLRTEPRHFHQTDARASADDQHDGEVSALALVNVLLRYRRFILALSLGLAAASLIYGVVRPRMWSAVGAFVPQGRSAAAAGGLSGLAAQFGVAVPGAEPTQSSAFYQDLLRTDAVLGTLVDSGLVGPGTTPRTQSVADLYRVRENNPALRRVLAMEELSDHLDIGVSTKTGLVRFVVHAPDPVAALNLAQRALGEVTRFNLETRQSQGASERRFVERRLAESRAELADAETRLREFSEANRVFSAPRLALERERLARNVALRQEVYASLAQSYERARIEEVRDTPVITVVEVPTLPVRPDSRGLARLTLLSLFGGALFASMLAYAIDFVRSKGGATEADRAEFSKLTGVAAQ